MRVKECYVTTVEKEPQVLNVGLSAGLDAPLPEEPTEAQIADACMWQTHDFGLCDDAEKRRRMFSMRQSWRAIWKALNTPGRGGRYAPASNRA